MTNSLRLTREFKEGALFVGAALIVVAALPLLAVVSIAGRLLLPILAVVVVLGALLVPAVRRWILGEETEPVELHQGLRIPLRLPLSPAHAWARVTGRREVTVGGDDLLHKVFGPAEAVSLPAPGTRVGRGEPLFRITRGRRTVKVPSPIEGTVVAVNGALGADPSLMHRAPYDAGWAVRLEAGDRGWREALRSDREARVWFREEADRLLASLAQPSFAPALQDGGVLVADLHEAIDDLAWERIRQGFFEQGDVS